MRPQHLKIKTFFDVFHNVIFRRPRNLKTKIFLDSGDPVETKEAIQLLGFLDGQTTNPSLFAKHPDVQARIAQGNKFTKEEIYHAYKHIIQDIRTELRKGSISIEVYADTTTTAEEMIVWGREMNTWIDGAHIKLPTTRAGLEAAEQLTREGINVNMTLVFSESQAAAVHAATMHTADHPGQVYLSPFIGRLDDTGENGVDLIANCLQLYREYEVGQVQVLAASVRTLDHFLAVLALNCDLVTAPLAILKEWAAAGMPVPDQSFVYDPPLAPIPFASISFQDMIDSRARRWQDFRANHALTLPDVPLPHLCFRRGIHWGEFDIEHKLTDAGLKKFAQDWNALIQ